MDLRSTAVTAQCLVFSNAPYVSTGAILQYIVMDVEISAPLPYEKPLID
jgi:hypothetical protein